MLTLVAASDIFDMECKECKEWVRCRAGVRVVNYNAIMREMETAKRTEERCKMYAGQKVWVLFRVANLGRFERVKPHASR